jgi:hypothetical protein
MDFQQWLQKCRDEIYQKVSTNNISLLKDIDLDRKIKMIKEGKYYYYTSLTIDFGNSDYECHIENIYKFLNLLSDKKLYIIIPILSINKTTDEPYIILSRQFLVSKLSNCKLITSYINDKIHKAVSLYQMKDIETLHITFKYKQIEFNYEECHKFN